MTHFFNDRRYQLLRSTWRRAIRWEFWPMWVFYIPIVIWIVCLTLRYRSIAFLSVNPGFTMSGLFGENKADSLAQLSSVEELARFELIAEGSDEQRIDAAHAAMHRLQLDYPVVLKPDAGQRGADVVIIRDEAALCQYLQRLTGPVLLQEYVAGEEFGVFFMRDPNQPQGRIFSITEKTFPIIVGDGQSSIEQLLMANPRTHYMAAYLLKLHEDKLDRVLTKGQTFKVVEIGAHSRGSVFLDANHLITPELEAAINRISGNISGFFFGRYDLRVPNRMALQAGEGIKVLEVNGVTSESTNMYDPSNSVLTAYRIMFSQWACAFKIGKANIQNGSPKVSLRDLITYLFKHSNNS